MKLTQGAGFVLILPFVLVGFGKNKTELLFYCLIVTTLLTMTNGYFAPKGLVFSMLNRFVYLLVSGVMVLQIVAQRNSRIVAPMVGIVFFLVYMAVVSAMGWQPIISYLKLLLFIFTFLAFYSVANAAASRENVSPFKIRSLFLACATIEILGSVALLPFPAIGMMRVEEFFRIHGYVPAGSLFSGMTVHSQALGPTVAMFSGILLADMLFSLRRWNLLYVVMLLCSAILIYKTGSRTAMGTWLAGLSFAGFVFMCAHGVGTRWKNRALGSLFLFGLLAGVAVFAIPQVRKSAVGFIYKARGGEVSEESRGFDKLVSSRQGLFDNAMENFRESPWIGNGFQVGKYMMGMQIDSYKQLLSAPIEKGVWVSAILEEGGIFGLIIFLFFILSTFSVLLSRRAFVGSTAFFIVLVSNLGEFTLFSMSGMGGIFWSMTFIGLTLDAQRIRHDRWLQQQFWQRGKFGWQRGCSIGMGAEIPMGGVR